MSNIELKRMQVGISSVDENYEIVDGQVAEFTLDGKAKAIRINCTRKPGTCPALSGGKCVTSSFDSHSGDPIDFETEVDCGKTPEGIQVAEELF